MCFRLCMRIPQCVCLLDGMPAPCTSVILATERRLWYGIYAGAPSSVGRCLKRNGAATHQPTEVTECNARRRRRKEGVLPSFHTLILICLPPSLYSLPGKRSSFPLCFIGVPFSAFFSPGLFLFSPSVSSCYINFLFPPLRTRISRVSQVIVLMSALPRCFSPRRHHDLCVSDCVSRRIRGRGIAQLLLL